MRPPRLEIGAGAAFGFAAMCIFLTGEELLALLLPVTVHELGHLVAMLAMGFRPQSFRAEPGGFQIAYSGEGGALAHSLAAAAGPLAGLLYALAAARLQPVLGLSWLYLSAGLSLALSLLNLLPALPLDGGQILLQLACAALGERRGERLLRGLSLLTGAALLAAGGALALRGRGVALALVGLSLLFHALRQAGLVKMRKIR